MITQGRRLTMGKYFIQDYKSKLELEFDTQEQKDLALEFIKTAKQQSYEAGKKESAVQTNFMIEKLEELLGDIKFTIKQLKNISNGN